MTIEVNNKKIEAKEGEYILQALKRAGIYVPTLCHLEGLIPSGACRMCVVEVEGFNDLVPSCAYPVSEGMKIKTHTPRVINARKVIIELLLSNHPDDCLFCIRNRECELQHLAEENNINYRRFIGSKKSLPMDASSMSIVRDPEKCILCGRCVRICEEVMGVSAIDFIGRGSSTIIGPAFNEGLNISSCINCGQCIMVCPTGALSEQSHIQRVLSALANPEKVCVVQMAPSISVTIGELFGMKPGEDKQGLLVSALRAIGFNYVFDTSFSADLTIMEEATELVNRIKNNGILPMMTSCSPGWIKFVEQFYPEFIENLSTCKSPQQMLGAIIKSYFAEKMGISAENIYSVAVMPCTAKKFEASREELTNNSWDDIDAVLTTRELVKILKIKGIDFKMLEPSLPDNPFGERSSAGKIFAVSGGVLESAIRTAYYLLTKRDIPSLQIKELRGLDGIKTAYIDIDGFRLGVCAVSGLANARKVLNEIKNGRNDIHFIEVMTCPGGCIAGGGQPFNVDPEILRLRMQALYKIDEKEENKFSYKNNSILKLYEEFLGEPNSKLAHTLLHTKYHKREVVV